MTFRTTEDRYRARTVGSVERQLRRGEIRFHRHHVWTGIGWRRSALLTGQRSQQEPDLGYRHDMIDGQQRPREQVVDGSLGETLQPHDREERAVEPRVGEEGVHLCAFDHEPADRRARQRRLRARSTDRRRGIGLELR